MVWQHVTVSDVKDLRATSAAASAAGPCRRHAICSLVFQSSRRPKGAPSGLRLAGLCLAAWTWPFGIQWPAGLPNSCAATTV